MSQDSLAADSTAIYVSVSHLGCTSAASDLFALDSYASDNPESMECCDLQLSKRFVLCYHVRTAGDRCHARVSK